MMVLSLVSVKRGGACCGGSVFRGDSDGGGRVDTKNEAL